MILAKKVKDSQKFQRKQPVHNFGKIILKKHDLIFNCQMNGYRAPNFTTKEIRLNMVFMRVYSETSTRLFQSAQ